jgi:hypothetical protein
VRIGIDFDNTLVCYDRLFRQLAMEAGFFAEELPDAKQEIRDFLRSQPNGEIRWQQIQALAYGPRIDEAELFPGVVEVLTKLGNRGEQLFVVSHKSRFAAQDNGGCDLRQAAHGFLASSGLFAEGLLAPQQVYFEASRADKAARIGMLECDLFIDDLPETFAEEGFPSQTRKILFAPRPQPAELEQCRSWQQIGSVLEQS